jgi:DNA-binding MarR family transcriptional regulator
MNIIRIRTGYKKAMANQENSAAGAGREDIVLGVLTAIDRDSNTSQRTISRELDVALGLANAYLKRCVRKGLIKIKQVPRRRYAYYLTPQGFAEKSRLTAEYLSSSFNFFRKAREQISGLMRDCAENGHLRVAFAGVSDLAEVGTLCAHDHPITLVGIVDASRAGEQFSGLPVRASLRELGAVDAVIVTSLAKPDSVFRAMEDELGQGRVLAPQLLPIGVKPGTQILRRAAE